MHRTAQGFFHYVKWKDTDVLTWQMLVSEDVINSTDLFNCSDLGHRPKLNLTDLFCSPLGIFIRIQLNDQRAKNWWRDLF